GSRASSACTTASCTNGPATTRRPGPSPASRRRKDRIGGSKWRMSPVATPDSGLVVRGSVVAAEGLGIAADHAPHGLVDRLIVEGPAGQGAGDLLLLVLEAVDHHRPHPLVGEGALQAGAE